MTATLSVDLGDDEIRAVPPERLVAPCVRVLPFTPRLTDAERWQRLCARDPRSAGMIQAAFRKLYAYHFPDEDYGPQG